TVRPADAFCTASPCPLLTVASTVHHGPVAYADAPSAAPRVAPVVALVESRLRPASLWPRRTFVPAPAPLRAWTSITLGTDIISHAGLPAMRFVATGPDAAVYAATAGFNMRAFAALDAAAVQLSLQWPWLRIAGAGRQQFRFRALQASLQVSGADRQRHTTGTVRVDSVQLGRDRRAGLRLDGLNWRFAVDATENGAQRLAASVDRISHDDTRYGPLRLVGSGSLTPDWSALIRRLRSLAAPAQPADSMLQQLYALLLVAAPSLDLQTFELTTPAGHISGRLRISVPAGRTPTTATSLPDRLRLDFDGDVPAQTLRRAIDFIATQYDLLDRAVAQTDIDKALQRLLARELIEPLADGRGYHLRVAMQQGRIRIADLVRDDWADLLELLRRTAVDFSS